MEADKLRRTILFATVFSLIIFGIFIRLIPHIPNFAPVGAIALFGGAMLGRRFAVWLPLAIMMVSDLVIGAYSGMIITWIAFALVGVFGLLFMRRSFMSRITLGAVGASLIFFLVSNFGTWLTGDMYAMTLPGLIHCYVMGLPFLRPTLLADMAFATVLFGSYELASLMVKSRFKTVTA